MVWLEHSVFVGRVKSEITGKYVGINIWIAFYIRCIRIRVDCKQPNDSSLNT